MDLRFLLNQAQSLKSELDTFRPLDAGTEARILQKLRLDWNYHSNHLEGGKLTYGETKALILFGITAQGKPLQDHLETSGHDEAIKWIIDIVKNEAEMTEVFIRQLHELILKEPYEKKAKTPDNKITTRRITIGAYKTQPNHVETNTGEMFYFASPEETPARMTDLIDWYRQKKQDKDISPILLAAEFHYKFIRIHPFDDGNGRMARLLMNFILMQYAFPPAIIKTEDKENYYAVLRQADAGILEPFLEYIVENVIRSLELMLKGAKGDNIEDPDDLDKEIALLENKLKAKGEKIEKEKNEETLKEWFNEVLPYVTESFIQINEKFKRFYVGSEYQFYYPKWEAFYDEFGNPVENMYGVVRFPSQVISIFNNENVSEKVISVSTESIAILLDYWQEHFFKLVCKFHTFNTANITTFNYTISIKIIFNKTEYHITSEASKNTITKLYHQKPTDEEMQYVLQAEAQAHLQFIEEHTKDLPTTK